MLLFDFLLIQLKMWKFSNWISWTPISKIPLHNLIRLMELFINDVLHKIRFTAPPPCHKISIQKIYIIFFDIYFFGRNLLPLGTQMYKFKHTTHYVLQPFFYSYFVYFFHLPRPFFFVVYSHVLCWKKKFFFFFWLNDTHIILFDFQSPRACSIHFSGKGYTTTTAWKIKKEIVDIAVISTEPFCIFPRGLTLYEFMKIWTYWFFFIRCKVSD